MSSPRRLRRALLRSQILALAADLFRRRGYRATTLEELARRLGMSKATLYGYFRSKDELLFAVFERTMALYEHGLREIRASGASPVEQLRRVIRQHVRAVIAERSFLTVFFAEEASLPPRLLRAITRRKNRYDRGVEAIVRAGVRRGALTAQHPRLLVFAVLGMSIWVHKWYRPTGDWDPDLIANAFIALVEPGYVPTPRGARAQAGRRLAGIERELRLLRRQLRAVR